MSGSDQSDDDQRLFALEMRIRDLEQRLNSLEASRSLPPAHQPAAESPGPTARPTTSRTAIPGWGTATAPGGAGPEGWSVAPPKPISLADLEERLTGRVLAWLGGLALVAGALFFLSLAFSRGWIGPEARVAIGLAAGGAALSIGGWLFEGRRQVLVANVLVAVGLGIISIALVAATRLFHLVPVEVGLAGSFVAAIAAAWIAIRANAQEVAAYGLVAVLVAPPVLGADPNPITIAFLATALIGTTLVALNRAWPILPVVAFLLSAPQLASWIAGDVEPAVGLAVLAAYWLVNEMAAAGDESLRPRPRLRTSSTSLILANAAYLIAGGFVLLDGQLESYRGAFLAGVAVSHFVVGGWFLKEHGPGHPFGLLVSATGLAALTMAIPVQFGGPVVPIAWAAEMAALAWLHARRRHGPSGAAAALLGGLAVGHILTVEYGRSPFDLETWPAVPFTDPAGIAALFVIAALALSVWVVRIHWERSVAAGVAVGLAAYSLPFEASGLAVLVGWTGLAVLAVALEWLLPGDLADHVRLPVLGDIAEATRLLAHAPGLVAAVVGALALAHGVLVELPPEAIGRPLDGRVPFLGPGGAAVVILVAGALVAARIDGRPTALRTAAIASVALLAYGALVELPLAAAVVAWAALALAAGRAAELWPVDRRWYLGTADALVALGLATIFMVVAPPEHLVVIEVRPSGELPFLNGTTAALAALSVALAAAARWLPGDAWTQARLGAAGVAVVYGLSIGVVAVFQRQIGGPIATEELAKQAQVALSALWAAVGAGAFAVGLGRRLRLARQAGLVALGAATAKVFLIDLASLDVAYRVLSFVVLGIVLLASAYIFQRNRPNHPAARPPEGATHT